MNDGEVSSADGAYYALRVGTGGKWARGHFENIEEYRALASAPPSELRTMHIVLRLAGGPRMGGFVATSTTDVILMADSTLTRLTKLDLALDRLRYAPVQFSPESRVRVPIEEPYWAVTASRVSGRVDWSAAKKRQWETRGQPSHTRLVGPAVVLADPAGSGDMFMVENYGAIIVTERAARVVGQQCDLGSYTLVPIDEVWLPV